VLPSSVCKVHKKTLYLLSPPLPFCLISEVSSAELLGVYESNDAPKEDDIGTINALHWQERSPGIQRNSRQKFIVAVKTLKPEVLVTEESVYIFVEEIRTLSKVQHR
jgi:hypothetical protein